MPAAFRLGDMAMVPSDPHGCPACPHPATGPAIGGSTDVNINSMPAIRLNDPGIHAVCCGSNQWVTAKGSGTVNINNKAACRMGDKTTHCGSASGQAIQGSPDVNIGG
jgi:uncharacterized Zn-binding protein involved in type VI secretion